MVGSTLALAMGLVLLAAARASGNPTGYGLVVFVGILFVAASCAMHLGVVLDRLFDASAGLPRSGAIVGVWLLVGVGTAWLIGRAPGEELLYALMVVPSAVGIVGLVGGRDSTWSAAAYLAVAGILLALILSVLLGRAG